MEELTKQQKKVYDYLRMEIQKKGYPPAIRDICAAMGLRSTSTVHAHISALEEKGYIRRSSTQYRSLEILEKNIHNHKKIVQVPVIKRNIKPRGVLFAKKNIECYLPILMEVEGSESIFAIQLTDDIKAEEGLIKDDFVLAIQQDHAEDGDRVIVLSDKLTVRIFPLVEKVVIYGKVISLYRKYSSI